MKAASTDKIIEVVNMCPTEALSWKWNDEQKNNNIGVDQFNHVSFRRPELLNEQTLPVIGSPVSVKVMTDGPIVIKGNFTLINNGIRKEIRNSIISVCRCGSSSRLPFCDGQHRKTGFTG